MGVARRDQQLVAFYFVVGLGAVWLLLEVGPRILAALRAAVLGS